MKKKINIYRIIWISSIFLLLIVILIMIMDYKINYEYLITTNKKIYFYDCNGELCTSEVKNTSKKEYSTYKFQTEQTPIFKGVINEDYALLQENNTFILYNYKKGIIVSSGYDSYTFINNDYIIITKDAKDGIITIKNKVIINPIYNQIGYFKNDTLIGYNNTNIIANKDGKYGIISYKDASIVETFAYEETQLEELIAKININE